MLAAPLGRHVGQGAFQQFQQGLLHPFSGDIAGDRGIFALAGDLVDLIDINNAALGLLHIHVGFLQQPQQDVLHVFADVARLGQGGGIGHGEGHIQHLGQGLGEQGLAATGGANQQDVRLLQAGGGLIGFPLAIALPGQPFVVVVHRHRQHFFGLLLAHHLLVEEGLDLVGLGHLRQYGGWLGGFLAGRLALGFGGAAGRHLAFGQLLIEDLVAEIDAFVADINARAGNQLADLLLGLAAERALQVGVELGHRGERLRGRSRAGGAWSSEAVARAG